MTGAARRQFLKTNAVKIGETKMKRLFAVCVVFLLAVSANAQAVDHWRTGQECLDATSAGFYYPTLVKKIPLATDERIVGLPTGGCADMVLPDRLGGRGWVRVATDRRVVVGPDGKVRRLEECNNKIFEFLPFPAPVPIPAVIPTQKAECCPSVTKADLLEAVAIVAAAQTRYSEPPTVNVDRRWYCERQPVVCVVGAVLVAGAFIIANDGERGTRETVVTLKPCTQLPCN